MKQLLLSCVSLAGSIGGLAEACACQPIDVIKTRLQLDKVNRYHGAPKFSMCTLAAAESPLTGSLGASIHARLCYALILGAYAHYDAVFHTATFALSTCVPAGIWNCGKQIIEQEGVRSLWKGLTPFAMHLTLKYALRMGTNAFYQSLLRDKVRPHSESSA